MSNIGLSASELAQMRSDIAELLPDTCNILALTSTSDGAGGQVDTWGTATGGTAVSCRVDYRSGREQVASSQLTSYQSATISFAFDVTITPLNRIQVGANVFSIQAVNKGQSWLAITRATAELIP